MTLAFLALATAFTLTPRAPHTRVPSRITRAPVPVAFLEPELDEVALDKIQAAEPAAPSWLRTASGLRYKELDVVADAAVPVVGDVVELYYTATLQSTGRTMEETLEGRPLKFIFGANDTLPLFEEMVTGMSVGSKRRVMNPVILSSSGTEEYEEEVLQFDVELRAIPTGNAALGFKAQRALPGLLRTAILLSFVPDVLRLVGLLPPDGSFTQQGFGAVDILSTPDAHALAQAAGAAAAPAADAANLWAARGLQGLF